MLGNHTDILENRNSPGDTTQKINRSVKYYLYVQLYYIFASCCFVGARENGMTMHCVLVRGCLNNLES